MARISVVGSPFEKILLNDIDKRQSLREHTINPPGQERYLHPVDTVALQDALTAAGATETAAAVIAATIGADDISTAAIQAATASHVLTAPELEAVQGLLSYQFVETGLFLLSFDRGVLSKMVAEGWVKVFTDAGDALFSL